MEESLPMWWVWSIEADSNKQVLITHCVEWRERKTDTLVENITVENTFT